MHNKILPNVYHFIDNLNIKNILGLNKNICIIYRNYNSKIDIKKLLLFRKTCKKLKIKFLISNEIELAFKLKLDGAYLPSFNKKYYLKNFKKLPTYKLISNTGPRHKPIFKVGVKLPNTKYFIATGKSKKEAEQNAAIECLKNTNNK